MTKPWAWSARGQVNRVIVGPSARNGNFLVRFPHFLHVGRESEGALTAGLIEHREEAFDPLGSGGSEELIADHHQTEEALFAPSHPRIAASRSRDEAETEAAKTLRHRSNTVSTAAGAIQSVLRI